VNAEALPILYANTRFKASLTSDPKEIWRGIGVRNGGRIKQLEMHVDGLEDCVLYHCTPLSSPDLELVNIRITSRPWLGNGLDVQERLGRLHTLFTTRMVQESMLQRLPADY
jgi:hypothetical protein